MKFRLIPLFLLAACLFAGMPVKAADSNYLLYSTVPFAVFNVSVPDVSQNVATVVWNTNADATAEVYYDTLRHDDIAGYQYRTAAGGELAFGHSVVLTSLSANTTYHYRVRSAGNVGGSSRETVSDDFTFTTKTVTPTPKATTVKTPSTATGAAEQLVAGVDTVQWTPRSSRTASDVELRSSDGRLRIRITKGTTARTVRRATLSSIYCSPPETPAPVSLRQNINTVYEVGPTGATFSPEIDVAIRYNPAKVPILPAGINEATMTLAGYDHAAGKWVELNNIVVDKLNSTVSGKASRLTQFAVLSVAVIPGPAMPGTTVLLDYVNADGRAVSNITARCAESSMFKAVSGATLTIANGTLCLGAGGRPVSSASIIEMADVPAQPEGQLIVGSPYKFGPNNTSFNPAATLTLSYDAGKIPEAVGEHGLTVAYFDTMYSKWVELPTTVDTLKKTISAPVPHFTIFAVIGKPGPFLPASFEMGKTLTINPPATGLNEVVEIGTTVTNTGGVNGTCKLTLHVNGTVDSVKEVTVAPGATEPVSFMVWRDAAGIYTVELNGLKGKFTVSAGEPGKTKAASISLDTTSLALLGVTGIALLIATVLWVRIRRR